MPVATRAAQFPRREIARLGLTGYVLTSSFSFVNDTAVDLPSHGAPVDSVCLSSYTTPNNLVMRQSALTYGALEQRPAWILRQFDSSYMAEAVP